MRMQTDRFANVSIASFALSKASASSVSSARLTLKLRLAVMLYDKTLHAMFIFNKTAVMLTYSKLLFPLHQLSELPAGVRDLRWSRFRVHRHDGSRYLETKQRRVGSYKAPDGVPFYRQMPLKDRERTAGRRSVARFDRQEVA